MKRSAVVLIASAFLTYGAAHVALRWRSPAPPPAVGPVWFAIGGLVPAAEIRGGEDALRRLAAAHCLQDGPDLSPASPRSLAGVVDWERGTPVAVICPDDESARTDTLAGFDVWCRDRQAELYVRLARTGAADVAGCVVVVGAKDAVPAPGAAPALEPGERLRAAFRVQGRLRAWVERPDVRTGEARDEVRAVSEGR